MALFVLSDPHLCLSVDKPMDIFGKRWDNYVERIKTNWYENVTEGDCVVLPGDISWAMRLDEALDDFLFFESLPGTKIIGKGNHDYWWGTVGKINEFFAANEIRSIKILFNNAYEAGGLAVCGTRGWYSGDGNMPVPDKNPENRPDDAKILNRECMRLDMSLTEGGKLCGGGLEKVAFLHYPPVFGDFANEDIMDVLCKHDVKRCYYGHLHGVNMNAFVPEYRGVKMRLVSCDCINFTPEPVPE